MLFIGWKLGIPMAMAVLALYGGINIGMVWVGFVAALCWLGALNAWKQGDARAARGLACVGTVMALLSLWAWWE
jgi:hypothetical protein